MRASFVLLCASGLSACAALSEPQCRVGDWAALGERDGRSGHNEQRLQGYREACARYGITPDEAQYHTGRAKGLVTYCTPEAVFAIARKGQALAAGCPAQHLAALTEAQGRGSDLAQVESDLRDLQSAVLRLEYATQHHDLKEADRNYSRSLLLRLYRAQHRLELLAWRMETAFRAGRPAPPYYGHGLIY